MVSKANIKNKYTDREKNSCLYLVTARQVATPIAGGACFMKSYGTMEGVYINGAPQGITFHETDDFTLYPASILSVSRNRFTKHYFIGSQRIASRIGVGRFNNVYGINGSRVTAGQKDYAARMSQIEAQKEEYYKSLGIAPGVPTMKGSYGDPENTGVGYNSILTELGKHDVPENWIQLPKNDGKCNSTGSGANATPGGPVAWEAPSNPENAQPGYGYVAGDTTELEETFYYHSDHLGSTSYVTDGDGNITQYEAYLPYGELLVDEHSSSESMPYKFNGKQLDDETGLYYYGARYMNPVASIWYGVDPLAEKYQSMGGMVYCESNPIKYIDPNGMIKRSYFGQEERLKSPILYRNYLHFKDNPTVLNLFAHGSFNGFSYKGNTSGSTGEKSVKFFYDMIQKDRGLKESYSKSKIIVLHMCSTAKFAEKISRDPKFKDALIIAPSGDLAVSEKTPKVNDKLIKSKAEYSYRIIGATNKKAHGVWKAYRNGRVVANYKDSSKPGSIGFNFFNTKGKNGKK